MAETYGPKRKQPGTKQNKTKQNKINVSWMETMKNRTEQNLRGREMVAVYRMESNPTTTTTTTITKGMVSGCRHAKQKNLPTMGLALISRDQNGPITKYCVKSNPDDGAGTMGECAPKKCYIGSGIVPMAATDNRITYYLL
jgi:hypothetical protein